jgi:hypothetical protein
MLKPAQNVTTELPLLTVQKWRCYIIFYKFL